MAEDGANSCAGSVASGGSSHPERFILEFIKVVDVPAIENRTKCDIYLQAFLATFSDSEGAGGRVFQSQKFGQTVQTPVRYDCNAAVWNCFRNLGPNPPPESVLTVELYHHYKDTHKTDCLLGKVDIPVRSLVDGEAFTFPLINFKSGLEGKNPELAVTLRRVFTNRPPPLYRTFFVIRHGQSKWNRAMARINLTGMLDRDHALTVEGIQQATTLNSRWREQLLEDDNCYNNMHREEATMVSSIFDFSRMDEDEELALSDDGEAGGSDDSDSDNEVGTSGNSPMVASAGSNPKSAHNSKGKGLVKLYDSFFTKRGPVLGVPAPAPSGEESGKKLGIATPVPEIPAFLSSSGSPRGSISPMNSGERNPLERRPSEAISIDIGSYGHNYSSLSEMVSDMAAMTEGAGSSSSAAAGTLTSPNGGIARARSISVSPQPTAVNHTHSRRTFIYNSDSPSPTSGSPSLERCLAEEAAAADPTGPSPGTLATAVEAGTSAIAAGNPFTDADVTAPNSVLLDSNTMFAKVEINPVQQYCAEVAAATGGRPRATSGLTHAFAAETHTSVGATSGLDIAMPQPASQEANSTESSPRALRSLSAVFGVVDGPDPFAPLTRQPPVHSNEGATEGSEGESFQVTEAPSPTAPSPALLVAPSGVTGLTMPQENDFQPIDSEFTPTGSLSPLSAVVKRAANTPSSPPVVRVNSGTRTGDNDYFVTRSRQSTISSYTETVAFDPFNEAPIPASAVVDANSIAGPHSPIPSEQVVSSTVPQTAGIADDGFRKALDGAFAATNTSDAPSARLPSTKSEVGPESASLKVSDKSSTAHEEPSPDSPFPSMRPAPPLTPQPPAVAATTRNTSQDTDWLTPVPPQRADSFAAQTVTDSNKTVTISLESDATAGPSVVEGKVVVNALQAAAGRPLSINPFDAVNTPHIRAAFLPDSPDGTLGALTSDADGLNASFYPTLPSDVASSPASPAHSVGAASQPAHAWGAPESLTPQPPQTPSVPVPLSQQLADAAVPPRPPAPTTPFDLFDDAPLTPVPDFGDAQFRRRSSADSSSLPPLAPQPPIAREDSTGNLSSAFSEEREPETRPRRGTLPHASAAAHHAEYGSGDAFKHNSLTSFTLTLGGADDDIEPDQEVASEASTEIDVAPAYPDDDDLHQRREEYIRLFLLADIVYSSPLTRAVQTALAAMCGHPALTKNKLTLYRVIREIKHIGGLDTVGVECGAGIIKRVQAELQTSLGAAKAADLMDKVQFATESVDLPWWTQISSFDDKRDQLERVREFMAFTRYCPHAVPVFVGHSLFFRVFYSKRIAKAMAKKRPNLSAALKRFKLSNASVLAVTVKYHDLDHGMTDAMILDADVLFGGGFHGAKLARPAVGHHDSAGGGGGSETGDHPSAVDEDIDGSLQLLQDGSIQKLASHIQQASNNGTSVITKSVKNIINSTVGELF